MDFLDSLGGLFDGASDWFGRNKKWLEPVVSTGFNLYTNSRQNNASKGYADLLARAQQEDYNNQKANYDAYTQWLQQSNANDAANRAASNARAAANEKARLAGVAKAKDQLGKTYKKMSPYIDPYADMGLRVRPEIENTYMGALKALSNLTQQNMTPEAMKQWNQSKPAWEINAPLPDWMKR